MVLLTIIANCIVLALEEHLPNHDKTPLAISLVNNKHKLNQLNIFAFIKQAQLIYLRNLLKNIF